MAGPKFFVYGGSRWREVCTTSGRVNGWGNVQFLTVRCGRLQVARKNTVLRGLRSLAASQPTTVHDGPPLSQIRYNNSIEEKKDHDCLQYQHHHCCKQNDHRYNSDVIFNNIFKAASTCSAAVQCSLEVSKPSNKSIKGPNQTSSTTKNGVKLLFAKRKRSASEDEQEKPAKKHVQSNIYKNTSDEEIELPLVERRQIYDKYDRNKSKTRPRIIVSEDDGAESVNEKKMPLRSGKQDPVKSGNVLRAPKGTRKSLRAHINDKRETSRGKISSSENERDVKNKTVKSTKHRNESDEEMGTSLVKRRQIYHVDNDKKNKSKSKVIYKNRQQISSNQDEQEKPDKKHVQLNKRKNTSDEEIESSVGRRQIDNVDKDKNDKSKSKSSYINRQEISSSEDEHDVKYKTVKSTKHRNESDEEMGTSLVERRQIYHVDNDKKNKSKSKVTYKNRQQISSNQDEQEKPDKKHVQLNKRKNTSDEEIESSVGRRQIDNVDKDKNDKSKSKSSYINRQEISSSEDEHDVKYKTVKSTKHRNESDDEMGTSLAERRQIYDKYDVNKPKTRPRTIILSEDDSVEPVNGKKMPLRRGKQGPVKSGNVLTSPEGTRKSLRSYIKDKQEMNEPNNTQSTRSSNVDINGIQLKPAPKSSQTIEEMLEKIFNTTPTRRPKRKLSSDDESYREVKSAKRIAGSNQELVRKRTKEMENGDDSCKELVITEEDIQLLRTFIENDNDNIFDVNLEKFDTDDNHKRAIFYKLNPLVNVARCKRIATMLRNGRNQSTPVSLEDFISTLGLRSVLDTTSQASSKYRMRARRKPDEGPDKENKRSSPRKRNASSSRSVSKVLIEKVRGSGNKKKTISTKRKKVVGLIGKMSSRPVRSRKVVEVDLLSSDSDSDSVFEKSKQENLERRKWVSSEVSRPEAAAPKRDSEKVVAKTSRTASRKANGRVGGKTNGRLGGKAGGREYTRAEDEAVVAWVRGAERARRVNGNQLWRELQPLHQQKTGHFRSWHSLRNRYLRYLLPSLGELALPPPEAVRLRAAAASGELKSRKNPQRANSLLREPRVRSAWSRRPRPPARESSSPSPSRPASPARSPTHASSSSLSPPARADSSHYSSRSNSTSSSNSSVSSRDSRPKDRRRSLRNSSAKKSETTRTQIPRMLRSSSQASPLTPTYSQLTRRFADESAPHSADLPRSRAPPSVDMPRPRAPHSADLSRPRAPLSAHVPRPRTRRLYNPNAT